MIVGKKVEIELRGKVIAASLDVEDSMTRIIHNFLYPKSQDKESKLIYLKELIMPLSFSKKKEILKQIIKSKRYKKLISPIMNEKNIIGESNEFENYEKYTSFVLETISEIIKDRNIIAHGYDISAALPSLIENGYTVLANKTKSYKYSEEDVNEFYYKAERITNFLSLLHIEV